MKSGNPKQAVLNLLGNNTNIGNVKKMMNGKTEEEKAQMVADKCNELGITKEQLQGLFNILNK